MASAKQNISSLPGSVELGDLDRSQPRITVSQAFYSPVTQIRAAELPAIASLGRPPRNASNYDSDSQNDDEAGPSNLANNGNLHGLLMDNSVSPLSSAPHSRRQSTERPPALQASDDLERSEGVARAPVPRPARPVVPSPEESEFDAEGEHVLDVQAPHSETQPGASSNTHYSSAAHAHALGFNSQMRDVGLSEADTAHFNGRESPSEMDGDSPTSRANDISATLRSGPSGQSSSPLKALPGNRYGGLAITNIDDKPSSTSTVGKPGDHQTVVHGKNNNRIRTDTDVPELDRTYRKRNILAREKILNSWDVAAFIVNKQIGTGIFTKPATVLILCGGNRTLALCLWVVGFGSSFLSTLVYLQFSKAFFWTGGELVFLNETFRKPRLLAFTVYSVFFIAIYTTATNANEMARQILYLGNASSIVKKFGAGETVATVNTPMQSFIAIVAIAFLCLVHYISREFGRLLNKATMFIKILILVVVIIGGAVQASKRNIFNVRDQMSNVSEPENLRQAKAIALIYILFTYQGWENASFVLGEIEDFGTFRRGILAAIITVGMLYIAVNGVFLASVLEGNFISTYVPELFGFNVPSLQAWSFMIAFSSAGNLTSVIYTCSRVKQVIGKANILPWSKLWSQQSRHFDTPTGGLLLHWIFSTITILACTRIKTSDGYAYPGTLQVYGHAFFGVIIAVAFLRLPCTVGSDDYQNQKNPEHGLHFEGNYFSGGESCKHHKYRRNIYNAVIGILYLALNLYVVIGYLIPPYQPGVVKGWVAIAVIGTISVAGILYYVLVLAFEGFGISNLIGLNAKIEPPNENDAGGSGRGDKVSYKPSLGDDSNDRATATSTGFGGVRGFVYKVFGGRKLTEEDGSRRTCPCCGGEKR